MNKNASEKKQGQFHQGQYVPAAETGRPVCRIHKFPGSPKKYLPKKADCMVSYRYSSFRVDMVDCFLLIRFYHKPVRSCLIFMKKKSLFYAGFRVSQSPIKITLLSEVLMLNELLPMLSTLPGIVISAKLRHLENA